MLDKKQVLRIRSELRKKRFRNFSLEEELIDFVCCEVETKVDADIAFETALEDVLHSMNPGDRRNIERISGALSFATKTGLIRNYFQVGVRNLFRHKTNTAVNLAGLVLGLSSLLIIALFVHKEFSFDGFHPDGHRLYRVNTIDSMMDQVYHHQGTSPMLRGAIQEEIAQVESVVSIRSISARNPIIMNDRSVHEYNFSFVQADFFKLFNFPTVHGIQDQPFPSPFSVLVTESFAKRIFGDADPIGQLVSVKSDSVNYDFTITGILKDLPYNTHLNNSWDAFDLVSSEQAYRTLRNYQPEWTVNDMNCLTYVKLQAGIEESDVITQVNELLSRRIGEGLTYEHYLQPVSDIRLNRRGYAIPSDGNWSQVYTFSLIGILILVIACINYVNLTTAKVSMRNTEAGIRKVLGANKNHFLFQFSIEAFLVSTISLALAAISVYVLLGFVNQTFDLQLTFSLTDHAGLLIGLVLLMALMSLIAAGFPGFYMAKMTTANLLKTGIVIKGQKFSLRKLLVVFQFGVSAAMIICTLVIVDQLNFLRNKELGFIKEAVVYVKVPHTEMGKKGQLLKNTFAELSQVKSVSLSGSSLATSRLMVNNIQMDNDDPGSFQLVLPVDFNYAETMGLTLHEGRWFDPELATDHSEGLVVNKAFVKHFSLENPIGKSLARYGEKGYIIGVVDDFHFKPLHVAIEPLVLHMNPGYSWNYTNLVVKLNEGSLTGIADKLESAWNTVYPERLFDWYFLDDRLEANYRNEQVFGDIFKSFAVIAIVVSCLGLLGLVSFSLEKRSKEIGIRKVLGASVKSVMLMITGEFSRLILIGFVLAVPTTWYFLSDWLLRFEYRIGLEYPVFILAAVIVFLVALLVTGYLTFKTARTNPAEVLKTE